MKKLFLLSLLISLISPIKTFAGFPEGEKGFDLKKIEESFKLPCDEIGNKNNIVARNKRFKIIKKSSGLLLSLHKYDRMLRLLA